MPFTKIPITDILTDGLVTSATWKQMRDNLESFHDHTTGKGKPIPSAGIPLGSITDAKIAIGGFKSKNFDLTKSLKSVASTGSDIVLSTFLGTGNQDDTALSTSLTVSVPSVLDLWYIVGGISDMTGGSGNRTDQIFKINGVAQLTFFTRINNFAGDDSIGVQLFRGIFSLAAGTYTLVPRWQTVGGSYTLTINAPRHFLAFAYGQ